MAPCTSNAERPNPASMFGGRIGTRRNVAGLFSAPAGAPYGEVIAAIKHRSALRYRGRMRPARVILFGILAFSLGAQNTTDLTNALAASRQRIDKVDDEIVKLLNERAAVVLEIGAIKKKLQLPAGAPGREEQVLRSVAERAQAPLTGDAVRKIFSTIITEMTVMEQKQFQLK